MWMRSWFLDMRLSKVFTLVGQLARISVAMDDPRTELKLAGLWSSGNELLEG